MTALAISEMGPFRTRTDLQFTHPLTLLIGPNGSGKSTVLLAVRRLRDEIMQRETSFSERIVGHSAFTLHQGGEDRDLSLGVGWARIFPDVGEHNPYGAVFNLWLEEPVGPSDSGVFRSIVFVDPAVDKIADGWVEGRDEAEDETGAGVARKYARASDAARERIFEGMRHVLPFLDAMVPYEAGGRAWVNFSVSGTELSGPRMSDGTLRAFAILTELETAPDGGLLLIEEPDAFIDPNAVGVILDALLAASDRMQIIATTHSPDLLQSDAVTADMVRTVTRTPTGSVISTLPGRLAEAVDAQRTTVGELLRSGALSGGAW